MSRAARVLRDPLLLFLLCGLAIWIAARALGGDDSYRIDVRAADIDRLTDQWVMQMRREPTPRELAGLIEQFVKEEIYYREALRLGLDRDDTIVRRRMVQKLTFLTEDIATATPQDEATVRAYYDAHREDYRVPERYSFRHRYFSSDRREDARADATAALNSDAAGDPFMLQRDYALRSEREIGDLFGREFAAALAELEPSDAWQGPLESAYGWHAVRLERVTPASIPPFEEIAERVAGDARQAVRRAANADYYASLRERYDVALPDA